MVQLRKLTFYLAVLLTFISLPLYSYKIYSERNYSDFFVYYRASERLNASKIDQIYDFKQDGSSPFRYAPASLPLLKPLAYFPIQESKLFWFYLQFLSYTLGFFFLYRSLLLLERNPQKALWITCASLLFVFRLCLDTFTSGQVSGFMFLGFSLSLFGFLGHKPFQAGGWLFFPALFKLAPAFLFLLFIREGFGFAKRSLGIALLLLLLLSFCSVLAVGSFVQSFELWKSWIKVVSLDASYFDAAHYGSQSLLSFGLRISNLGWISREMAILLTRCLVVLGCLLTLCLWLGQKTQSLHLRAVHFALGIFAYLYFMPETFKYSQSMLAIPVAILLAGKLKRWEWASFIFGVFAISTAGLDIIGAPLFFSLQIYSVPFLAITFLYVIFLRKALCFHNS